MIQIVEREDFLRIADKETALIIIRDTTCCGDEALHIVSMATLTDEMPEWVDIVGCWVGMRCYKPETLYDILSEYKQCGERVESWEDHYPADASYYICEDEFDLRDLAETSVVALAKDMSKYKVGATKCLSDNMAVQEWKCPLCCHRWYEEEGEYPETCPRCGSDIVVDEGYAFSDEAIMSNMKLVLSAYCRWRINHGYCHADDCLFCAVNVAYEMADTQPLSDAEDN